MKDDRNARPEAAPRPESGRSKPLSGLAPRPFPVQKGMRRNLARAA